jgi:hypothetical protein
MPPGGTLGGEWAPAWHHPHEGISLLYAVGGYAPRGCPWAKGAENVVSDLSERLLGHLGHRH